MDYDNLLFGDIIDEPAALWAPSPDRDPGVVVISTSITDESPDHCDVIAIGTWAVWGATLYAHQILLEIGVPG